jgi:three-Cys-motif partner protein
MRRADPNPEYWSEYSNLQHVKHELIRHYLNGWFPKMTLGPSGCRRLLYIDTHAGRGQHLNGQLGSPLVALTTLLGHQSQDRMLRNAEVRYFFIERDEENVAALKHELTKHTLPMNVFAEAESGDCFEIIEGAVASFEKDGGKMAPGFIFVDPYGFNLPGTLLRRLLEYPRIELFVNVIWRELDMAIRQVRGEGRPRPAGHANGLFDDGMDPGTGAAMAQRRGDAKSSLEQTLGSVFAGDGWRTIVAEDADARAEQCADLFRQITGARWGTHIRMLDNGRVRYFLLHLTNHDAGRDLMKECIWKACPGGGYYASKSDNPRQQVLIQPEPDLRPLRSWVTEQLSAGPKRWQDLAEELRGELWLGKHLNDVIHDMRRDGEIDAGGFTGMFAQSNNPCLSLSTRPKQMELF